MCSRPADLVFAPTLACGDVRRRTRSYPGTADSHPLPNGAGLTSKPLHARRRTVVLRGSFRPRLASTTGVVPRATTDPDGSTLPSIGTATGAPRPARCRRPIGERATRRQEVDRACAGVGERLRARGGGRPGGQHVVHEQERRRWSPAAHRREGAGDRREPLLPRPPRLRTRGRRSTHVRGRGEAQSSSERPSQVVRLIDTALGPPPGAILPFPSRPRARGFFTSASVGASAPQEAEETWPQMCESA